MFAVDKDMEKFKAALDFQEDFEALMSHPTAPAVSFQRVLGKEFWKAKQTRQRNGSFPLYLIEAPTLPDLLAKLQTLFEAVESEKPMPAAGENAFEPTLERFVKGCEKLVNESLDLKRGIMAQKKLVDPRIVADPMFVYPVRQLFWERRRRWIFVWSESIKEDDKFSFCFVDPENGDYYAPGSYGVPAKHKRGNIFDDDPFAGVNGDGVKALPNWRHGYGGANVMSRAKEG